MNWIALQSGLQAMQQAENRREKAVALKQQAEERKQRLQQEAEDRAYQIKQRNFAFTSLVNKEIKSNISDSLTRGLMGKNLGSVMDTIKYNNNIASSYGSEGIINPLSEVANIAIVDKDEPDYDSNLIVKEAIPTNIPNYLVRLTKKDGTTQVVNAGHLFTAFGDMSKVQTIQPKAPTALTNEGKAKLDLQNGLISQEQYNRIVSPKPQPAPKPYSPQTAQGKAKNDLMHKFISQRLYDSIVNPKPAPKPEVKKPVTYESLSNEATIDSDPTELKAKEITYLKSVGNVQADKDHIKKFDENLQLANTLKSAIDVAKKVKEKHYTVTEVEAMYDRAKAYFTTRGLDDISKGDKQQLLAVIKKDATLSALVGEVIKSFSGAAASDAERAFWRDTITGGKYKNKEVLITALKTFQKRAEANAATAVGNMTAPWSSAVRLARYNGTKKVDIPKPKQKTKPLISISTNDGAFQ